MFKIEFDKHSIDFAEWLTAVGTLLLAITTFYSTRVSLRLANQNNVRSLLVNAALLSALEEAKNVPIDASRNDSELALCVTVTNDCQRTLLLAKVFWIFDDTRVEHAWIGSGPNAPIDTRTFPRMKITPFDGHAESCGLNNFYIVMDRHFSPLNGRVHNVEILAQLSTGEEFKSKVSGELERRIKERVAYIHRVNLGFDGRG